MSASNNATPEIPLALLTASQEDTTGALFVGTFCTLMCVSSLFLSVWH